MRKYFVAALLGLAGMDVNAQEVCGTDFLFNQMVEKDPSVLERREAEEERIQALVESGAVSRDGSTYVIPTVVHVIYSSCEGNISRAQVEDGIDILNRAMNNILEDSSVVREEFQDHMGALDIEFRLAKIDPAGNPTDGINRRQSSLATNANDNVKSLENWGNNSSRRYFQIWVVENINIGMSGQVNGYAYFPNTVSWNQWGVVIRNDKIGSIGTSNADGSTLSHEVGHNFNLYHTFQDGCGSSCSSTGDRVCDTPPAANPDWSCSSSTNTCTNDVGSGSPFGFGTPDMMENIMSYSSCRHIFTNGQVDRMRTWALDQYSYIEGLYAEDNMIATGVGGFQQADFASQNEFIIADQPTIMEDRTLYESDGWKWDFGASSFPPTSNEENPEVTFIHPGLMPVSFTAYYQGDSLEVQRDVMVVSERGIPTPFVHSFEEASSLPTADWFATDTDLDGNTWTITNSAGFSGDQSIMIENVSECVATSDMLTSATLDLEAFQQVSLDFRVAYAQTSISSNDILRLWMTRDYGQSWDLVWVRGGTGLRSVNDYKASNWAPESSSEWQSFSVNFSNSFKREGTIVRFEFVGDGGSNLYIDDIEVTGTYKNQVFLVSPANGELGMPKDVLIDWKAVGGVDFYEYQIDRLSSFDSEYFMSGTIDYIDESPENEDTEFLAEDLQLDSKYYWRVRASKDGVYTEWSVTRNFRISGDGVGIEDIVDESSISLYPNPTKDAFTVKSNAQIQLVQVLDVSGRVVRTQAFGSAKQGTIDVSDLQSGTYFAVIETSEGTQVVKPVVIQ